MPCQTSVVLRQPLLTSVPDLGGDRVPVYWDRLAMKAVVSLGIQGLFILVLEPFTIVRYAPVKS
jgi:hypothetical protein